MIIVSEFSSFRLFIFKKRNRLRLINILQITIFVARWLSEILFLQRYIDSNYSKILSKRKGNRSSWEDDRVNMIYIYIYIYIYREEYNNNTNTNKIMKLYPLLYIMITFTALMMKINSKYFIILIMKLSTILSDLHIKYISHHLISVYHDCLNNIYIYIYRFSRVFLTTCIIIFVEYSSFIRSNFNYIEISCWSELNFFEKEIRKTKSVFFYKKTIFSTIQ